MRLNSLIRCRAKNNVTSFFVFKRKRSSDENTTMKNVIMFLERDDGSTARTSRKVG